MSVEYISWYWIYPANIWGIYIIWRVSVLRNVHFLICILVLDINCQHLGNICQLAWVSVRPSGAGLGNLSSQELVRGGSCPPWNLSTRPRNLSGGKLSTQELVHPGTCLPRNLSWGKLSTQELVYPGTCLGGSCPGGSYSGGTCLLADHGLFEHLRSPVRLSARKIQINYTAL